MKIIVCTGRYPNDKNPYNHTFVHIRNKYYLEFGYQVEVMVPSTYEYSYVYEGVLVYGLPVSKMIKKLSSGADDYVIFFHLFMHSLRSELDAGMVYEYVLNEKIPSVFFIHGIEVQSIIKDRPWDNVLSVKPIMRAIYKEFFLLKKIRLVFERSLRTQCFGFIAVSNWMLDAAVNNMRVDFTNKCKIIPNGIDTVRFSYHDLFENRRRILTIRPLIIKSKYGVDLAVKAMKYAEGHLTIYGKGKDYLKLSRMLRKQGLCSRVMIDNKFIHNKMLPLVHKEHGIYHAVTRMDAQGVSMCEAMASGLPIVSYNHTAIPEFIEHGKTGLLVDNFDIRQAADFINELIYNKNLYYRITENARTFIETIDIRRTVQSELDYASLIFRNCLGA